MDELEFKNLTLDYSDDGAIAIITMNRPKALNALNAETLQELGMALEACLEPPETMALIITGAGEKSFVAGADISEFNGIETAFEGRELALGGQDTLSSIAAMPIPTIAAINGFALGGGLELALACDLRVASKNAKLGLPEVGLGLIPGYGGTQRLPRLVGEGRALDLILTARHVGAEEALSLGLVNRVSDNALETAEALAREIIKNAPVSLGLAKEAVRRGMTMTLNDALELEADLFGLASSTKDMKEGVAAFLEKRKANFVGE
jgi:enoyl-CoA hydratase